MADLNQDQAIEAYLHLPPEKQAQVWAKIPTEKKRQVLLKIGNRKTQAEQKKPGMLEKAVGEHPKMAAATSGFLSGVSGMPEGDPTVGGTVKKFGQGVKELASYGPGPLDTDPFTKAASYIPGVSQAARIGAGVGESVERGFEELTGPKKTGEERSHGAGSIIGTGAAILGGEKLGTSDKGFIPDKGTAPGLIRRGAQELTGVGPERTTRPLVEDFKTDKAEAITKQGEENVKTEAENVERKQAYHEKLSESFDTAKQEQIETEQDRAAVQERNQAAAAQQGRRTELATDINKGSKEIGETIAAQTKKDGLARQVGNEKYDAVKAKVANDPGVSPAELAPKLEKAVKDAVKGSPEKIRQVQDIVRKGKAETGDESVFVSGMEYSPTTNPIAWQTFLEQGIVKAGEPAATLAFGDLQGYSTELGNAMARGIDDGDVYQAVKSVKELIDKEKTTIAERNGAGTQLKDADGYWRHFMETFYDKPSAAALARERVGGYDPEFYAEGFLRGKAAKTTISNLRKLGDMDPRLKPVMDGLAGRAEGIRKANQEFQGLPKKAKTEAVPSSTVPPKKMPVLEEKTPKQIEQPNTPTVADVKKTKSEELSKSSREIGRLSKYDAAIIGSSVIGPFFGRWETLLIDPALIAARKGVGHIMSRPAVIEWLSQPNAEDLRILSEVNPQVQSEVRTNMNNFVNELKAHGEEPTISPEVKKFLGAGVAGLKKRGDEIVGHKRADNQ